MKVTLQTYEEITLSVNDQEMTFSEQELVSILKEHFKMAGPREGIWFYIDPLSIDQNLFQKKRRDKSQEATRLLILEAFENLKKYPDTYAKPFRTLMPQKTWVEKDENQLIEVAQALGKCIADWIYQALEWAQRIHNGETWKKVCNEKDTANWYRLIRWKDGSKKIIGGARKNQFCSYSATQICSYDGFDMYDSYETIPLIVDYD